MFPHIMVPPSLPQATAIFEAAATVIKEGVEVFPHIMVPLVGIELELDAQAKLLLRAAIRVQRETGERRRRGEGRRGPLSRAQREMALLQASSSTVKYIGHHLTRISHTLRLPSA